MDAGIWFSTDTNATPYHVKCRLLNCLLITSWMIPLLFSPHDSVSMVSKKNFKFWLIWSEEFSILSQIIFRLALAQGRRWCFWIVFTYGFFFAWSSFHLHLWITWQTMFTDSDFWKHSWVHTVVSSRESCLFIMQCCPRAWRSHASSFKFQPCPMHTDTSPDSLNLLMILCAVDGGIFKVFAILHWVTFFWNCFTIFRCILSQTGEPINPSLYPRGSVSLKCSFKGFSMLHDCCSHIRL